MRTIFAYFSRTNNFVDLTIERNIKVCKHSLYLVHYKPTADLCVTMNNKAIVTVNEGRVRGIKKKSAFSGAEYYSFFGIPYGQSTAALSRFKVNTSINTIMAKHSNNTQLIHSVQDPVKVKPWKNVLDATTEKEGCYQFALQLERFAGSEDCLYNNIHIPKVGKYLC